MKILTKPIRGMTVQHNISQIFHSGHRAWDVVANVPGLINGYGTPLCAMEDVRIEKIVGDTYTPDSTDNLRRGYGVWCTGLETGYVYIYWHVLPYLPVHGGDIIKRGKIVAFMGNAGKVYSNGIYVPIEKRTIAPFSGTHLHLQTYVPGHPLAFIKGGELDPMDLVDFNLEPNYSIVDHIKALAVVIKKMATVTV